MKFTIPVYITINAKNAEIAKEVITNALKYEQKLINFSYNVSHPINDYKENYNYQRKKGE